MGWSASWVAIEGASKAEVLESLRLEETDEEVLPGSRESEFSCHELPNGWFVVFCEYFDGFEREQVLSLSRLGLAIGCQFEDKVAMTSVAVGARDGSELWRIFHENDRRYRLDVSGEPPEAFEAIRDRIFHEQKAFDEQEESVDAVHDIPFEVARAVCGYRHDEYEPAFVALRGDGPRTARPRPERTSVLGKLLSLFGGRG